MAWSLATAGAGVYSAATIRSNGSRRPLALANELADGAKLAARGVACVGLDRPVKPDHLLAGRGDDGAATVAATHLGGDGRLAQRLVDLLDQQPRPAIRHTEPTRGAGDRAGGADRLQERDLA